MRGYWFYIDYPGRVGCKKLGYKSRVDGRRSLDATQRLRKEYQTQGHDPGDVYERGFASYDPHRPLNRANPWMGEDNPKTVRQVYKCVCRALRVMGLDGQDDACLEYFDLDRYPPRDSQEWWKVRGEYRRVACYAVTGGNEGHYIHVDFVGPTNPELSARVSVMLGKTFCGMEHATKVASALSCLLGA